MPDERLQGTPQPHAALFVDDDPNVLRGLERLLRPLRAKWNMHFVASAPSALELLEIAHIDVLVTDIRMPVMSGVELMEHVLRRHPNVVRIALSGRAERETVIRAAHLAHQYLSKPCEPELLKDRLGQAVRLRGLLQDGRLQAIVSRIATLHSVPTLYVRLMAEMQMPEPSIARIARIVAEDPAMTAKVLQVINSAYFGLRAHVADPETAVRLLGFETVQALTLAANLDSQLTGRSSADAGRLWHHCTQTARLARQIAGELRLSERSAAEAFTAGLLHDVGTLILARAMDDYDAAMTGGREEGLDDEAIELRAFGATHAQVGGYLLGLWGLPYGIVEAVAWHHAPRMSGILEPCALTAVHLADVLECVPHAANAHTPAVDADYLSLLGLHELFADWKSSGIRAGRA